MSEPGKPIEADLCVIGAGSGGLSVAAGASQMGARTVLVEKGRMGGDCLNYGCVPSKALLAAGNAAQSVRRAGGFGIRASAPGIDADGVYGHVRATIAAIEPNDSQERFEALGVRVIRAPARFTAPSEIEAGGLTVRARRFVIATGSSPMVPPIPGLEDTPYLTNETVFELNAVPEHLIVIGGGPIGIEMAQAHRRLGARITVAEMGTVMPRDDPELVDLLRATLREEGIELREKVKVVGAEKTAHGVAVTLEDSDGGTARLEGSHLLVAAGRKANVDGLGLEAAGINHSARGIVVDSRLRTSNRKVFALGDVIGGMQFTHVAGWHAGVVIRNALFRLPAKAKSDAIPWVTYTAPELAQVGLTEAEARQAHDSIRVMRWPFHDNDRARADNATTGLVKVVTTKRGKILGASILGPHAGELIQTWVLAIGQGLKIGAVASMIAPYPTLGEASKRAAGGFYTPKLFGETTRKVVRLLAKFG